VYNRFHRGEWITWASGGEGALDTPGPLNGIERVGIGLSTLKVPKREIFDRSDFPNFYTIKSSWVGDLLVKILTYYFNF
jgi:hypothetical protein